MKKQAVYLILMLLVACAEALATDIPRRGNGQRQGPPPEAYRACEGKRAGDAAEFTSPFGEIVTGTCVQGKGRLFLRPDFMTEQQYEPKQRLDRQLTAKPTKSGRYPIVDTGVRKYYSNRSVIQPPSRGKTFYGQDAQYNGNQPSYTDNRDGTVTDNVTGLMWQQDMGEKMTWAEGMTGAARSKLGGYTDWRVPTIKELYSLILFTVRHGGRSEQDTIPYIDTRYFRQPLGNRAVGERIIDAQTWSATRYTGKGMGGSEAIFGVNFIDGRIKAYPERDPRTGREAKKYFRFVRGNTAYGKNIFVDNNDGTVSDRATGLMWQQADDGRVRDWEDALGYAEKLTLGGYTDWRLPNAKELQSIVDYTRSPLATSSPALDPVFQTTKIDAPDGQLQYPYFWTGTTHQGGRNHAAHAVYIAFGRALGRMHGRVIDVHGAGAQRSDPKTGDPDAYPQYFGPQGDMRIVFNYVRCVRDIQ